MKKNKIRNESNKKISYKKVFHDIYYDDFDDPCEEFADVLYDLIPEEIIKNELKKIKDIKLKHGKCYSIEKIIQ